MFFKEFVCKGNDKILKTLFCIDFYYPLHKK